MFFVFLGSLDNPKSIGTNTLIKEGAKIVLSAEDIAENYIFLNKKEIEKEIEKKQCIEPEYRNIFEVITNEPQDIETIMKKCKINIGELMSKLTMMELEGKILKVSGNRYIRN